jgi:hypothetical protein
LMVWLFTRPIRLEITQTQVRAFHGSVIKKAATTAGKAIYKASGIQSIVSCVTNPNLASCVRAAVTVVGLALTIATGGAGAVVDAGIDAAADAAADAATDMATDSAADATEDVTDTEGGGGLKETAGDVWNKIKLYRVSEGGHSWKTRLGAPLPARPATWVAAL